MKESVRISKLFEDLYDGSPWIDVTLMGTLKNISAEKAARKIAPDRNSIWQILNHIISWRNNVLQRVQGEVIISPDDNYFTPVAGTSEKAWRQALQNLEDSELRWIDFLKKIDESQFERIYPRNEMTFYEHIQGILQHDAYHLGQIVLLSKLL
ncbi:MAG TPA: DinB family protein [Hanamia sp.]|jgi:uncharacterized damage-inducible protein DinB|nr:DinB family protein [Hanamia sp.]